MLPRSQLHAQDQNRSVPINTNTGQAVTNTVNPMAVVNTNAHENVRKRRNAVSKKPEDFISSPVYDSELEHSGKPLFTEPTQDNITEAYLQAGFEMPEKLKKRDAILREGEKKYALQQMLVQNEIQQEDRVDLFPVMSVNDARKLSDKQLVENYAAYDKNNRYLSVRYSLIKNPYYSLLPIKTIKTMSRSDLMDRIRKLYEEKKDVRNTDLICYYRDVIMLIDMENETDEPLSDTLRLNRLTLPAKDKLEDENKKAFEKNSGIIHKNVLTEDDQKKRIETMKSVMMPKNKNSSWHGKDTELPEHKKEGIRRVLAWMYRNCNKSSESKEPFVYKLTKTKPEKLLLMFFMIEKDKMGSPSTEDFYTAITDYTPDVDKFKSKVVAPKWKFWRRIGDDRSDSVINWNLISQASRFAMQENVTADYKLFSEATQAIEERIKNTPDEDLTKKRDDLIGLIALKGNLLLTLYRGAGISPDMPPELIKDPNLQKKVTDTMLEFKSTSKQLFEVLKKIGPIDKEKVEKDARHDEYKKNVSEIQFEEGSSTAERVAAVFDDVSWAASSGFSYDDLSNALDDLAELSETNGRYAVSGLSAFTGILDVVSSIINIKLLIQGASDLSTADHVSQALGITHDLLGGVNDLVYGVTDILAKAGVISEAVDDAGLITAGAEETFSTLSGGVQVVGGAVSIAAGLAKTASGVIDFKRGSSTKKDIQRSSEKLRSKKNLTGDDEDLHRFLKHQKNAAGDMQTSGGVKVATGTMMMIGGALAMTGILAPLGGAMAFIGGVTDIAYNLLFSRKRKKLTRKKAVDEALKMDEIVTKVRLLSPKAAAMKDDELRDALRSESLCELGYATYSELFSDICKKNARLLYKHVFEMPSDDPDYEMYLDALKSVGTKLRIPKKAGDEPFPTVEVIYSKLME